MLTAALYTSLSLWGGPGPASAVLYEEGTATDTASLTLTESAVVTVLEQIAVSDTASLTLTESGVVVELDGRLFVTQLGLYGISPYTDLSGREASTDLEADVSDIAYLQAIEEPIDGQEIISSDIARISVSETVSRLNFLNLTDSGNLSISETVALSISGVALLTPTDTAAISVTDTSAVDVTLDVTDTASISITDDATVDVGQESYAVTDTASVSITDATLVEVFAGVLAVNTSDIAALTLIETASALEVKPGIRRITFQITNPRMTLEVI